MSERRKYAWERSPSLKFQRDDRVRTSPEFVYEQYPSDRRATVIDWLSAGEGNGFAFKIQFDGSPYAVAYHERFLELAPA